MTPAQATDRLDRVLPGDPAPFKAREIRELLAYMADEDARLLRVLNRRCTWVDVRDPDGGAERVLVPGCGPALNGDNRCDCDSLAAQLAEMQTQVANEAADE